MQFWVGTTDGPWFDFLRKRTPPVDEVNFWQPSAKPLFRDLPQGTPFLFKLKAPHNCIAGGGYFTNATVLPLSLAWATFEQKNGRATIGELQKVLKGLHDSANARDPQLLCNVLVQPFFWPEEQWIRDPIGWSRNIVRGKRYDTANVEGARLWQEVQQRLSGRVIAQPAAQAVAEDVPRYGTPTLHRPRLGQGAFRVSVTDAYQRRCAITGENTLLVLEAAHIKPYSEEGPHEVANGMLLRSDFHKLFDAGLVTVTPDLTVKVSSQIKEQYFNGKVYYRLQGQKLSVVPEQLEQQPSREFLAWHNENRFVG